MFNFSENHPVLLSRTEYRSCAVFRLRTSIRRAFTRLYDFTRAQLIRRNVASCVVGNVNSAGKLTS